MPTIIEELAMTLKLDPKGFEEGAERAETATGNLLQRILASLQQIEQQTQQTAANTTRVHQTAAEAAAAAAEKAAATEETAANRAAKAKEEAAKKAAREEDDATKKAAQSHKQAASQAEEAYHKTANAIRRVGVELLAMLGISLTVSAVEKMFAGINKANTEAGYLARNIGINVEQLSAWQQIAERVGGTAQGIAEAFSNVAQQQWELTHKGTSTMVPAVQALFGQNIIGDDGKILQGDALIDALRAAIKRKGMNAQDIAFNAQAAGLGGLTPVLQASDADLARQRRVQSEFGATTTNADQEAARKLTTDLAELHTRAMGLAAELWRGLSPAIDNIVRSLGEWIEKNEYWLRPAAIEWGKKIGDALTQLAKDFKTLTEGGQVDGFLGQVVKVGREVKAASDYLGGFGESIKLLAEIWAAGKIIGMIGTMARIAAGVAAIGAAAATTTAALLALAAAYGINKNGQNDTFDRAEKMGYKINNRDSAEPTFTKDGVTIDFHEMQVREGYGPNGQTLLQSMGYGRPPMPGEPGGPPAAGQNVPAPPAPVVEQVPVVVPPTGPTFGAQMTPQELERRRREREGTPAVRSVASAMADAQASSDAVTSQADAARKLQDAADNLNDAADNLKDSTDLGPGGDDPAPGFFGRLLQRLTGGGGAGAGGGGGGGGGAGSYTGGTESNRIPSGEPGKPVKTMDELPGDYSWGDYGTRANNPGNLNFANWENADAKFSYTDPQSHDQHSMAVFSTMEKGVGAAVTLMKRNQEKYGKTLAGALHGWAVLGYVDKLGMDPNAPFDVENLAKNSPDVLSKILQAQFKREGRHGTHSATPEQIMAGIKGTLPTPSGAAPADVPKTPPSPPGSPLTFSNWDKPSLTASPAALETLAGSNAARRDAWATKPLEPVGAATAAQGWQMSNDNSSSTDRSNTTHIAALHVHSAADNAAGIAHDIHREIRRYDYATQSDTGLV